MQVLITKELLNILPSFDILAYSMDVLVKDSSVIEDEIKRVEDEVANKYTLEELLNVPLIKEARDAYKKLGKDPSRYRLAVESLHRRLIKGNKLYRINNVVDAGNLLSIVCARSTAILDLDKIVGDVKIRIGRDDDEYYGIGRGRIDVSNIPVYEDSISPFGSSTSDTERTMVTNDTKKILVFIICFSNTYYLEDEKAMCDLFNKYCEAKNILKIDVIKEK